MLAIAIGALVFAFCFGWSFLAAFHAPAPHNVPVGVVAPAPQAQQLGTMLNAHVPGGLSLHPYATPDAAREAVLHRSVEGAFVAGPHPVLMVASAGGNATAQFLQTAFGAAASSTGLHLRVSDLVPLPAANSEGLTLFFLLLSVLIPSLAVGIASSLAARGSKTWLQGTVLIVTAAAMGAVGMWIANGITGAVHGHFLALAGICALLSLAISASTAALARIAPPAAVLAVLAFVVVGVPATGGPVGLARFMPAFFRDLAPGLPASRALPALTNTAYFGGHQITNDLWILAIYAVADLVVLPLAGLLHRGAPGGGGKKDQVTGPSPAFGAKSA
ncbi:MAG: hypothetical protein J2P26_02085 [Nocardiopsaceae bacterium]|nr:hypothetical protein [Nocardiopsaceae bacterium]